MFIIKILLILEHLVLKVVLNVLGALILIYTFLCHKIQMTIQFVFHVIKEIQNGAYLFVELKENCT